MQVSYKIQFSYIREDKSVRKELNITVSEYCLTSYLVQAWQLNIATEERQEHALHLLNNFKGFFIGHITIDSISISRPQHKYCMIVPKC